MIGEAPPDPPAGTKSRRAELSASPAGAATSAIPACRGTANPGGWPRGGQTVVSFRNQHLSYAVTWFGLALCQLGVWFAYHISKGRIVLK